MESRSRRVSLALEKDLGVKPEVRWNTFNGTLQNVTTIFPVSKVYGQTTANLEARVRIAVAANFDQPPKTLIVSLKIEP